MNELWLTLTNPFKYKFGFAFNLISCVVSLHWLKWLFCVIDKQHNSMTQCLLFKYCFKQNSSMSGLSLCGPPSMQFHSVHKIFGLKVLNPNRITLAHLASTSTISADLLWCMYLLDVVYECFNCLNHAMSRFIQS